jgi:hypothetical protein
MGKLVITVQIGHQTFVLTKGAGRCTSPAAMLKEAAALIANAPQASRPLSLPKPKPTGKGLAYVIACALYARAPAEGPTPIDDVDDRLYAAIDALGYGANEVKADLYAQMAERLTSTTRFDAAVIIIEGCLANTNRTFFNG